MPRPKLGDIVEITGYSQRGHESWMNDDYWQSILSYRQTQLGNYLGKQYVITTNCCVGVGHSNRFHHITLTDYTYKIVGHVRKPNFYCAGDQFVLGDSRLVLEIEATYSVLGVEAKDGGLFLLFTGNNLGTSREPDGKQALDLVIRKGGQTIDRPNGSTLYLVDGRLYPRLTGRDIGRKIAGGLKNCWIRDGKARLVHRLGEPLEGDTELVDMFKDAGFIA
jgi:hypothetical protein